MTTYIKEIKRQFRDNYGFKPVGGSTEDPVFGDGQIPDGVYPMTIEGKVDHVRIKKGQINCCNFKNIPKNVVIHRASSLEEAKVMKSQGKDPIVVRANDHEVYVYVRDEKIAENIWTGSNWSVGLPGHDEDGYETYIYTRLNEDQLVEHLQDPTKFQGSD